MVNYKRYEPEFGVLNSEESAKSSSSDSQNNESKNNHGAEYYFNKDLSIKTSSKTGFQLKNIDQPDLFSNRFDIYFIDPNKKELSDLVSYLFKNYKDVTVAGPVKDIFTRVSAADSLAVRCSGITLPGYTLETTTLDTPSWNVELPTGLISMPAKGSISFRLDKHAALADLFSTISGKFDSVKMFDLSGYEYEFSGQIPTNITNLFQHESGSTTPYKLSDVGLCLVVTVNAMKRFPVLNNLDSRAVLRDAISSGASIPERQEERSYSNAFSKSSSSGDYTEYSNSFPTYVFENIKIVGVSSDIALSSSYADPPDITIDFIYRRFRLTHNNDYLNGLV